MPAPFIPAPGVVQAELRMSLFGQLIENVLYFSATEDPGTAWGSSELDSLATTLLDWVTGEIIPIASGQITFRELYLTDLTTSTGVTHTEVIGAPGAVSGACMPGNVTVTISFRTNGRGRSSRGRNYIPGIPQAQVTGNAVSSTFTTNMRLAYQQLNFAVADAGRVPVHVVVSRYTAGAPRVTALIQPVVAYIVTDNNLDSQRRRLTGRGL